MQAAARGAVPGGRRSALHRTDAFGPVHFDVPMSGFLSAMARYVTMN
jgi:hypothetical protein